MTSTPPPTAPSAPSQLPPRRPAVQRSTTDSMLGGVCGGLAEYSGIDAVFWRVGAVALALAGPGLLVYLLLWVALPLGPAGADYQPNVLEQLVGRIRTALDGRRGAPAA